MLDSFSNSGFNLACLHLSGKVEKDIDKLQISVKGIAMTVAPSFKNFPAILSRPAAFEGFILFRRCSIFVPLVLDNVKSLDLEMWFYNMLQEYLS